MTKKRKKYSAEYRAKVALDAVREQETVAAIARKYKVHANLVYKWKRQLLENLPVPIRHIDPGIKSHPSRATGADFQTGAS